MKNDRLQIPVDRAYAHALGVTVICFARLQTVAICCCEALLPGYGQSAHLALNGYTPQSYREAFDLPRDYPMIAATYAEKRRAIAIQIGLGRKAKAAIEPVVTAKPARKPRVKKVLSEPATG